MSDSASFAVDQVIIGLSFDDEVFFVRWGIVDLLIDFNHANAIGMHVPVLNFCDVNVGEASTVDFFHVGGGQIFAGFYVVEDIVALVGVF